MDELAEWFGNARPLNAAIVTGAVSGIVAVDCDDAPAIEWADANLPATEMRTRTGRGGEHITETDVDNPDLGSSFDLAVQGFLRIVGAVIIGLGYLIPITVLGALVWLAVWLFRRRRATA